MTKHFPIVMAILLLALISVFAQTNTQVTPYTNYGLQTYGLLYSAAGTALPTCNSTTKGAVAMVSDATAPTYHGTYTSGSTVVSPVFCNGSTWLTN